ncbi:MAG: hydrogenase nickel incorporation protein HypB [Thermoflexales bacterium]|nr:hydrogenase nickel incorporation protein HypB [Thermoflexales bacterium]MCS7324988.1 hydrogenase nickel incorporation protein HypB [Thermoflexales bacterium]MCX7938671.1 hydrogenase nickel incorporation protein HypB [Thermoflexales bacterium]MDW8053870.1 hydrogenase nickel incorporation protein HypB [Anaerolineae bacterium]MDW8292401.1 hydrogenase nickel incorporation protein HypB [Anaerolineae bacterium]
MLKTRLLELRQGVLSKNDQIAERLRERFHSEGVLALNFVSAPGSGKTMLLERVLERLLRDGHRVAVLAGDLETDNDAQRLARTGALVHQIQTHGACHLEAEWVQQHIAEARWDLSDIEFLFIENVGNLVCPSSYDLGEDLRVVLISVTEGEDKPLKYPVLFNSADVAVITKIDLVEAVECDLELMKRNIRAVRPDMRIFETSAKRDIGIQPFVDFLIEERKQRFTFC